MDISSLFGSHANATDSRGATGLYTICPVLVASNIAVEMGWLDEECARAGVRLDYLRSLPDNAGWLSHFRHSVPTLLRDGGAITTLWGRSQGVDTVLIAVSPTQTGGQVLTKADSDIATPAGLAGRRIALPLNQNPALPDFSRAIAEHGMGAALKQAGLCWDAMSVIDIPLHHATPSLRPAARPADLWAQLSALQRGAADPEAQAVLDGRADALFSYAGRTAALVASGRFKVLADLSEQYGGPGQISNGPYTMAVNREFAQAQPAAVVAFLRAAIRGARWIDANRDEAAQMFTRMTYYHDAETARRAIGARDFTPTLSDAPLRDLEWLKNWLAKRGYLGNDFSLSEWVDSRYLDEALAGL